MIILFILSSNTNICPKGAKDFLQFFIYNNLIFKYVISINSLISDYKEKKHLTSVLSAGNKYNQNQTRNVDKIGIIGHELFLLHTSFR